MKRSEDKTAINLGSGGTAGTGNIDQSRHSYGGWGPWVLFATVVVICGLIFWRFGDRIKRVIVPGVAEVEVEQP